MILGQPTRKIKINYLPPLITLIIVVISGLSYWFIFQPLSGQIFQPGNSDLASQERELRELGQYLGVQKALNSNYLAITEKDQLLKILPEQKDIPQLFQQLEAIALDNGFLPLYMEVSGALGLTGDLSLVSPVSRKPLLREESTDVNLPEGVQKVTLSFKIGNGEYSDLKNFLNALENNERLFDIVSINYQNKLKIYDIILNTYYIASETI